jgi:asparagine synthetase B (glutamine-hydrolysing)
MSTTLQALEPQTDQRLSRFAFSLQSGGREFRISEILATLSKPTPGLTFAHQHVYPTPFVHESPDRVIVVIGSPFQNEHINVPAVVKHYLHARNLQEFARSLNGEFLWIDWDRQSGDLTVINDRHAFLPLFYAVLNERLVASFSYTDLWQALKTSPSFRTSPEAIFEFIWLQRVLGTKTYDTQSRFLPAASVMRYSQGQISISRYWTPDFRKSHASIDDHAVRLAETLRTAISRRMSDKKHYGLFLSGGLDTRTLLAACDNPPVCFTAAVTHNEEFSVAHELATIKGAPHRYLEIRPDHYSHHLRALTAMCGGMYSVDHALFYGFDEQVRPHVDVVFHGHGLDYLFQGMYLPYTWLSVRSHRTFVKRLRPLGSDIAEDYVSNISFRLKGVALLDYVKPNAQSSMKSSLMESVRAILRDGESFCQNPEGAWEYLLIHAISRHYPIPNVWSMMGYGEQRTASLDNDVFDLYTQLPPEHRLSGHIMRKALWILNESMAKTRNANTGLKAGASPWELTLLNFSRSIRRKLSSNQKYRYPTPEDRTFPSRDRVLREQPILRQIARSLGRSEALAAYLPFLDMDRVANDVDHWLSQKEGGSDFMMTLLTLDQFLRQY